MLDAIEAGKILVRDGTALPQTLQLESEPYMPGWRLVSSLDGYELGRKIHDAGWTFFYLAYETKATVFGIDGEKMMHRAIERILAKREAEAEKFNSLEIAGVAWWTSKRFLEISHVTVSAQSRHIQESPVLSQARHKGSEVAGPSKMELLRGQRVGLLVSEEPPRGRDQNAKC